MNFDMNSCWSRAVELVQANFQLLLIIAAVFLLLPSIAFYLLVPDMQTIADPFADQDLVAAQMEGMIAPLFGGGFFSLIFQFAGYSAMVALMGDGRPTVGQALGTGLKTVPSLFAILILFVLMYFLGAALIMLPITLLVGVAGAPVLGVIAIFPVMLFIAWLAARMSMVMPVMVLGGTLNPITAITNSFALTKPKQWPILGFWAIMVVIFFVVSLIFTSVLGLFAAVAGGSFIPALIIGVGSGLTSMIAGMVLCAVAVAMHGQLSGPSVDAIEDTFG